MPASAALDNDSAQCFCIGESKIGDIRILVLFLLYHCVLHQDSLRVERVRVTIHFFTGGTLVNLCIFAARILGSETAALWALRRCASNALHVTPKNFIEFRRFSLGDLFFADRRRTDDCDERLIARWPNRYADLIAEFVYKSGLNHTRIRYWMQCLIHG